MSCDGTEPAICRHFMFLLPQSFMTWQTCSRERTLECTAPLFISAHAYSLFTSTWFPWQLTNHVSGLSVYGLEEWLALINGRSASGPIRVTALFEGPSLSFFSLSTLFIHPPILLYMFFGCSCFYLVTSHPVPPEFLFTNILSPSSCFVFLSAAMLWPCSDLQPSLDRVRSASTTCLRPDNHYDRDRYIKKTYSKETFLI